VKKQKGTFPIDTDFSEKQLIIDFSKTSRADNRLLISEI
jgi:hypothetical protein